MAWSKEWTAPVTLTGTEIAKAQAAEDKSWSDALNKPLQDLGKALLNKIEKVYSNKMPTHDPYTNPDTHIYYQCACGAILDPGTKSFAALNNAASDAGWKVRWGSETYIPYCVECGKDIE